MSAKEDLYSELKKAVKVANQRMVRLEKKDELTPAYKIAVNNITNILGKDTGKPRFKSRKSMDYNEMEKELKFVKQFNNSVSSTITGMKQVVKKRSATLYKKYGATQLEPLYRILSSESYKKLTELLPSAMVVRAINDALNNGMHEDTIQDKLGSLISQESDEFLIDKMNDMLSADIDEE